MTTVWMVQEQNNENLGEDYAGAFKTRLRAVAKVREIVEEYIEGMLYDDEEDVADVRAQVGALESGTGDGFISAPGGQFSIKLFEEGLG